jgi:hypothetical protein
MKRFIANLVENFDSGKLDRGEFCQSVALAALFTLPAKRPMPKSRAGSRCWVFDEDGQSFALRSRI